MNYFLNLQKSPYLSLFYPFLYSCQNQRVYIIDCHPFQRKAQIQWEKQNKPARSHQDTLGKVIKEMVPRRRLKALKY